MAASAQEAKAKYEADGTVKHEASLMEVELRALLDNPVGRHYLLEHCKPPEVATFVTHCLTGWLDIQTFNGMIDGSVKTSLGLSIFRKYVECDQSLIAEEARERLRSVQSKTNGAKSGIFDEVQSTFFGLLYEHMFLAYRRTTGYRTMCAMVRRKCNRVKEKDFSYHGLIGQGGFGLVCDVTKKSTGTRYAMKLQRKEHIIKSFGVQPWRADVEKRAFASCHHPFIVELFFTFQTEAMVMMVMSFGTGRDLSKILKDGGPLTLEQVSFYGAEIVSALSYLHYKGLVYRDIKPGNVLLNMDGHIKLIDFGGVCDINDHTLGKPCPFSYSNISPLIITVKYSSLNGFSLVSGSNISRLFRSESRR
jgi:hypothetical protein